MSRLARVLQKVFGSNAGASQIAEFGSLAAGSPMFTTNPLTVQALSNYLQGWFAAVIGGNSPAIEDMNALFFLVTYQLAYMMQAGTPEWDATTTYYKGSLVNNGGGLVYVSLIDNNLNNALTIAADWRILNGPGPSVIIGTDPYCTHATLAAAVADGAVGTYIDVLLTANQTLASVVALTKPGWRIRALPGVALVSSGGGVGGISCQAARIEFHSVWFENFTQAITGNGSWNYGRVMNCNFISCTNEVDTSNSTAGQIPITLGNISE